MKAYRSQFSKLEKQLKLKIESFQTNSNKNKLINSDNTNSNSNYPSTSNSGFESNKDMGMRQSLKLESATRDLLETEKSGNTIQRELYGQTEKLKNIYDNTGKLNAELEDSTKSLGRIEKLQKNCIIY